MRTQGGWAVVAVVAVCWVSGVSAAEAGGGAIGDVPADRLDRGTGVRLVTEFTVEAFDRRLGPDYEFYHKGEEKFPEVWMAPARKDPGGREYQIGGPWGKSAGDYSSTQGQVWFVPDAGAFPVDRVTILEWAHGCFTEAPLAPWHGGFRPEPASRKWLEAAPPGGIGVPVGMARGMATGHWSNCGVMAFSSGLVAAAGTVTARGTEPTIQLPAGKVPTAVSVTNKNEFALVTVHDTKTGKGQVAVIAIETSARKRGFVHEWQDEHAWCLPNVGFITGLKLLGFVDLPGIDVPTGVCAVGNHEGGRMNGRDGNAGLLREYDLAKQADRDVFLKGSNKHYGSTTGWAVVVGKYEGKAAFIDLQGLFETARAMYFTTEENYQKTRTAGMEPGQWPWTFEAEPKWKPAVVKVVDVPAPTAVLASMSGAEKGARAAIASMDGTIGFYEVGGLASEAAADPAAIRRLYEVKVGRNPVCLAYQKFTRDGIIVASRGDRAIQWVKFTPKDAKVVKTLRDARMIDPVCVEQSDTHGIQTQLVTVADFKGKKVINYRVSQVVFATQGGAKFGMGKDGTDEFECGGVLEVPGRALGVSASNVN